MERPVGTIPAATIARLSAVRRWLAHLLSEGQRRVFSHDLAALAQVTPAQVRRDLMMIGYSGSPAHGYDVEGLIGRIAELLNPTPDEGVVLVGTGQLGRVLLNYLTERRPPVRFIAAFDNDPAKVRRVICGVPCQPIEDLEHIARQKNVRVAIVAVPAGAAQEVATRLAACGVRGILNFAPIRLRVPKPVFVENVDIATLFEKAAFFARQAENLMETRI